MSKARISRGEIYYYDFGSNPGILLDGKRPVLILQEETFAWRSPTVLAAPIIPMTTKRYLPSHIALSPEGGLETTSLVLLEKMYPINRDALREYMGVMTDRKAWKAINAVTKKLFGLWSYKNERGGDIRCFCKKCLKDYVHDPNLIVRRIDPLCGDKYKCYRCDDTGYEYMMFDKKKGV